MHTDVRRTEALLVQLHHVSSRATTVCCRVDLHQPGVCRRRTDLLGTLPMKQHCARNPKGWAVDNNMRQKSRQVHVWCNLHDPAAAFSPWSYLVGLVVFTPALVSEVCTEYRCGESGDTPDAAEGQR